jgi:hypothetical protein
MITVEEIEKSIKELFDSKFNIYLFSEYLKTSMNSTVVLLYPISTRNLLNGNDIKRIVSFFRDKLKMHVLYGINKKKSNNQIYIIEAYYDISFTVNIFLTYFKNNGNEYYFLNFIQIERESEEVEELLYEKAKRDIQEIEELLTKKEKD